MAQVVADTSALVSLGVAAESAPDPLALCRSNYDVLVPATVIAELEDVAADDDVHARAARAVLDERAELTVRSADLDGAFPLDEGENAAVALANEVEADFLLCDEFESIGLVHASLVDTRLVTTPTLLAVFVRNGSMEPEEAAATLGVISDARSWEENSYVRRARSLLDVP